MSARISAGSMVPVRYVDRVRERLGVDHAFLALVVVLWAWLYLEGLGDYPLRVWDESRYAVPARHMVESGGWLDPRIRVNTHTGDLALTPRLVKPPLTYWLQGVAMLGFGVTTFAARLPTALAVLGLAGFVYHLGRRTYDRRAGLAGAIVLLVFPGMLLGSHGGRAAVPDTLLALFGTGFVWFAWRGRERSGFLPLAGAFAGLAVMTKGFAAGVFVVVALPFLLRYLRAYLDRWRWTVAAVATTAVVALPWHLYAWFAYGDEFVDQYLFTAVLSRMQGDLAGSSTEPLFGFLNYPFVREGVQLLVPPYRYGIPVFLLGAIGAAVVVRRLVRRDGYAEHREKVLLAWWTLAVPATFVLAGGNHPWYFLPMYVPGSVLVGYVPAALADGPLGGWLGRRTRSAFDSLPDRTGGAAYAAVCVVLAVLLVATYAPQLGTPHAGEQRDLGRTVAREVPENETLHVVLEDDVERKALMAMDFYADRRFERATLERLRSDPEVRYAIVSIDELDRLGREYRVLAKSRTNGVAVVEFVGPPASADGGSPDLASHRSRPG
ncbi:MAG: 4-amino-4-deoxy-L-arabinose transferase-like glycosyltransferase [Halobacteriales archaeon]|jgi:4-amino-4-deoxy-L-arabinose transferase-like glycosyltransferase